MKFRTKYSIMERTYTPCGCSVVPVYDLHVDENGKKRLKEVGKKDIQEEIDAAVPSVDIHLILERFAAGDQNVLMQRAQVFYEDVSKLPTKLQDLMNLNMEASSFFDSLSPDLKQIYGYDYMQFLFDPGKMVDEIKRREHRDEPKEKELSIDKKEVKDDNTE